MFVLVPIIFRLALRQCLLSRPLFVSLPPTSSHSHSPSPHSDSTPSPSSGLVSPSYCPWFDKLLWAFASRCSPREICLLLVQHLSSSVTTMEELFKERITRGKKAQQAVLSFSVYLSMLLSVGSVTVNYSTTPRRKVLPLYDLIVGPSSFIITNHSYYSLASMHEGSPSPICGPLANSSAHDPRYISGSAGGSNRSHRSRRRGKWGRGRYEM